MIEACIDVANVHDRIPLILRRQEWGDGSTGRPTRRGCSVDLILS